MKKKYITPEMETVVTSSLQLMDASGTQSIPTSTKTGGTQYSKSYSGNSGSDNWKD